MTVLIPRRWRERVLSADATAKLAALAEVRMPAGPDPLADELPRLLGGAAACLTGWGTPRLTEELLAGLPELKLVAHTAGSVRFLLPADVLERGVRVSHAAAVMAEAVAEHVVAQALLSLQGLHVMDARMRGGEWDTIRESVPRHLLGGQVVGVWGAGRVGREVIRLLRAFGCAILVADPYLDLAAAESLGAELVSLEELFLRADVVSLHAPLLPETRGVIGPELLSSLRDGAVLINAGRGALVDEAALLRELSGGRIRAALDVFADEPLPQDSPLRRLSNVVLSPHVAGHSEETHYAQGQAMVDEIGRFLRGEPLRYEVTAELLAVMA
ncbi:MAG TPA: hydroxyacid dehydrogenase [Candidatus Dormibacteraeota bacterium]|nr:hydroxyacid dehydrogenase [Candidatus Dormibacteraeota bacterium]